MEQQIKKTSTGSKVAFVVEGDEIVVMLNGRVFHRYESWAEVMQSEYRFVLLRSDQPRVVGPFIAQ